MKNWNPYFVSQTLIHLIILKLTAVGEERIHKIRRRKKEVYVECSMVLVRLY